MSKDDDAHTRSFHERLGRIQGGAPNTSGTTYVGPGSAPKQTSWRLRRALLTALLDILMSSLGLIAGIAAVLGARVAALKLFGSDGLYPLELDPPVTFMGIELALALIIMILLMQLLGLRRGLRRTAVFIGFLGAIVAEQALVDLAPPALSDHYPSEMISDAIVDY